LHSHSKSNESTELVQFPSNIHGFGEHKSIASSQVGPVHPSAHSQVKSETDKVSIVTGSVEKLGRFSGLALTVSDAEQLPPFLQAVNVPLSIGKASSMAHISSAPQFFVK